MSLLLTTRHRFTAWQEALAQHLPDETVERYPQINRPDAVDIVVTWQPSPEVFRRVPNLKAILVPAAGVDRLLDLGAALPDVPIGRLVDPAMSTRMALYVTAAVLREQRGLRHYAEQQGERVWHEMDHADPETVTVGLLGYGALGRACATMLRACGYRVIAWGRSAKPDADLPYAYGDAALHTTVAQCQFVVCLLPLTETTAGILNATLFAAMPPGGVVINAARGGHLVEADLIAALDAGHLGAAVLDVFTTEPLLADSPLWRHPRVLITPHVAAQTVIATAAPLIADDVRRVRRGLLPKHPVDRRHGY